MKDDIVKFFAPSFWYDNGDVIMDADSPLIKPTRRMKHTKLKSFDFTFKQAAKILEELRHINNGIVTAIDAFKRSFKMEEPTLKKCIETMRTELSALNVDLNLRSWIHLDVKEQALSMKPRC